MVCNSGISVEQRQDSHSGAAGEIDPAEEPGGPLKECFREWEVVAVGDGGQIVADAAQQRVGAGVFVAENRVQVAFAAEQRGTAVRGERHGRYLHRQLPPVVVEHSPVAVELLGLAQQRQQPLVFSRNPVYNSCKRLHIMAENDMKKRG